MSHRELRRGWMKWSKIVAAEAVCVWRLVAVGRTWARN